MSSFGVIELASAKTAKAPGWAYVPDTSVNVAGGAAANRKKRARNVPGLSIGDQTVRQETKRRKEVEALDRDGGRDNTIPLPVRSGGRAQGKHTANVRKILQSQKTFGNHLDDFVAMQALAEAHAGGVNSSKRPAPKRDTPTTASSRPGGAAAAADDDIAMIDGNDAAAASSAAADRPPLFPPSPHGPPPPAAHPGDSEPLLASRVPDMPPDEELRRLLAQPPQSYGEATGSWEPTHPVRVFCEVCGYWGRVRCMKCGTRVCALSCLEAHREECVTRYGL